MITHTNQEYRNYEILLFDAHGEYTGCLSTLPNYAEDYKDRGIDLTDTWVRCQIIWDGYQMAETAAHLRPELNDAEQTEAKVHDAFHLMFADKLDELLDFATPESATIWKIAGGIEGLTRAFDALFNALNRQPSGDDDVFDYWPNTMDMLYAFATDLDELTGDDEGYRVRVAEMANRLYHERYDDPTDDYSYYDEWGHEARWPNPSNTTAV